MLSGLSNAKTIDSGQCPLSGRRPSYFAGEGQAKDLSFLRELKGPAKGCKFATGRLGLRPSNVWAHLASVWGSL